MKSTELPSYRAFMLATVPTMLVDLTGANRYAKAIAEAEALWNVINEHVQRVAAELEEGDDS